ncbi:efflux RND transporter periplasmic adaptor subunit [Mesorhizobium sp. BR1-1-16]|uniref:efflux RND transporter periplasmic adaptor subunit n=1 Tax=Mesorhizobium sp. BR1-1-16 TaxID=2876653 RepID=UPI001CCC5B5D|nr:efflux RND transporter periplasmic adaptor subunit [Mesorhizobium sp. BR1-1-16]
MNDRASVRGGKRALSHLVSAALLALVLLPASSPARAQDATPMRVGTVVVEAQPINPAKEFVGRIEAKERVAIRARVTGYLSDVLFKEGQQVKEGDLLYKIESEPFEAAVAQAQGALDKARGQSAFADAQLVRAQELLKTQSGTQATRDQRQAEQLTAKGDVQIAEANLKTAEINLGYTEIKSPINGLIGRTSVTKGNVVGPDSGVLTTIVSQDPMFVSMPISQREFLTLKSSDRMTSAGALSVLIRFSDGTAYDLPGKIDFVDVSVDRATDSVLVRAEVANPNGLLIDGQLVKVALQLEQPVEKILVPQSALIADQKGVYVFVVEDGKAATRRLTLGGESGTSAIVDDGLKAGDQVIVQGIEALRPGVPVTATPASTLPGAG